MSCHNKTPEPFFSHRSCYVNFAEHLLNAWNVNVLFPNAPNRWSDEDWAAFLKMIRSFGFNCFEYWVTPALFNTPALEGGGIYGEFSRAMRTAADAAHALGMRTKALVALNTIGPEWYFACPKVPEDRALILKLWRHWLTQLEGVDIVGIFPGDPGGCNRNGCNYETFLELALELSGLVQETNPQATVEIGTWGTPFSGWDDDMRRVDDWDGTWKMLTDEKFATPETPAHIWNGSQERAEHSMAHFMKRLPDFPKDTMVAINFGFSHTGDPILGGDAREYARAIAKTNRINTWEYSLSEGELICYPHWRVPHMAARRREEKSTVPYSGGMSYTMSPKLNLLTMFAGGRLFCEPDSDPDMLSREFCTAVFGEEHARLGELFEAFEVVQGWGHYPRRIWSTQALRKAYSEIIDHLQAADMSGCTLPLFPDPETYRRDLLWFAERFHEMAGDNPDRERIRREYWERALAIYDVIPMSADERAELAAKNFSSILQDHKTGL